MTFDENDEIFLLRKILFIIKCVAKVACRSYLTSNAHIKPAHYATSWHKWLFQSVLIHYRF